MNTTISKTEAFVALGALMEYPDEDFPARCDDALAVLRDEAADSLGAFAAEVSGFSAEQAQEVYTRSFDLSPVCVPYVSVHLFGAESFKRAELMTGLKAAYQRVGFDCGTELPDHIAVILRSAAAFESEEWADLETFALAPAADKMIAELKGAGSPWRHVVAAVRALLGDDSNA